MLLRASLPRAAGHAAVRQADGLERADGPQGGNTPRQLVHGGGRLHHDEQGVVRQARQRYQHISTLEKGL